MTLHIAWMGLLQSILVLLFIGLLAYLAGKELAGFFSAVLMRTEAAKEAAKDPKLFDADNLPKPEVKEMLRKYEQNAGVSFAVAACLLTFAAYVFLAWVTT